MISGLIQSFTFELPSEMGGEISNAIVVFAQDGVDILVKKMEDLTINKDLLYLTLSQEETGEFSEGVLRMQLQIETNNGRQYASEILQTIVQGTLGGVVIGQ